MNPPLVLPLRCPRCGASLLGLQQDVLFWCGACQIPHEVVGDSFVERQGQIARAVVQSEGSTLHLPVWAFHVYYATTWEDPERESLAQQIPRVERVYVTGFELHNASYFGDPGQVFTEARVSLEQDGPASFVACTRGMQDAKAHIEPHILTIIDRRVDITGMELSCTIGETWLWGVPFFDDGKFLRDGIVGLKIPAAAVDDVAGIRAHARAKR